MLKIQKRKAGDAQKCSPNLLPCRIHYDGNVRADQRYWNPEAAENGAKTAYFRGRKLQGLSVKLPDGYQGSVVRFSNELAVDNRQQMLHHNNDDDTETDEPTTETKLIHELATFDEVTIWGHEKLPDALEDPYSKGIDEWIKFAHALHSAPHEQDEIPERKGK